MWSGVREGNDPNFLLCGLGGSLCVTSLQHQRHQAANPNAGATGRSSVNDAEPPTAPEKPSFPDGGRFRGRRYFFFFSGFSATGALPKDSLRLAGSKDSAMTASPFRTCAP